MAKLTKQQATLHRKACDLVASSKPLTEDEKQFVLEHWHESADTAAPLDGAFFTPMDLARDMSLDVSGDRIIDLCAGTGRLAFACRDRWGRWGTATVRELVCVERNPLYVEVGKRVLPEAEWIIADVTDLAGMNLGTFSCAVGNPPYGRTPRTGNGPRYRGPLTHFHVIDIAADLARRGVFLIPQASAPFTYSGRRNATRTAGPEYQRFVAQTGIELGMCIGIDTAYYADGWHDVSPVIEVVNADFTERREPAAVRPGPRGRTAAGEQTPMFTL